jgi:hypothetical protein
MTTDTPIYSPVLSGLNAEGTFFKRLQDGRELQRKLTLSDTEHLGAAGRACALCGWALILQGNRLRIFDINLLPALHAIGLHIRTSYISCQAE